MKTFVVTGATGFIGGHLSRMLSEEGHRVVALVRDGFPPEGVSEVVRGQLEDLSVCERLIVEHEPDGVFHLAAQAIVGVAKRDPFHTLESNVRGTYNLLEAFRRHRKPDARMVVASSDKAYGEIPSGYDAYDEDMPLEGRGPYDVSKSCTDLITQSYTISYALPIVVIRAGNVYGPGDDDMSRIVPSLCDDVLNSRPLTIRSDGSPVREYLHVQDVARGYIAAYNRAAPDRRQRAYNLGTGKPYSVRELADVFLGVLLRTAQYKYCYDGTPTDCAYDVEKYLNRFTQLREEIIQVLGTRNGEIQRQVLDASKAETELGWKAERDLEYGLKETFVAAWRNRKR